MNFGNVIKRNDDDYIVFFDINRYGSGYCVVPREVDPENLYDIEEVRQYCIDNPEKVYDDYPVGPPDPEAPSWQDKIEAQITYTAMMTDTLIEE